MGHSVFIYETFSLVEITSVQRNSIFGNIIWILIWETGGWNGSNTDFKIFGTLVVGSNTNLLEGRYFDI